jgi:hypothetical protein
MKARALALLLAVVLCLSIVSPAVGGPSLGSVAKTAKKALSTAKKANNRALVALDDADAANRNATGARTLATTANNAAADANRGPAVKTLKLEKAAGPSSFVGLNVACPAGYLVSGSSIGNGALQMVFEGSYGAGVLASLYNPSTTSTYSGNLYVTCIESSGLSAAASASQKAAVRAEMRTAVRAVASKSCGSGYTHAVMPDGAHKCLRAGQFCSRKRAWQRVYHRLGFHCKANGHLTYY